MAYNAPSLLDQAIQKFGGGDAAYENKLKLHIRDMMGYSNWINKMNEASGKPLALNLKGNITPEGIKSLVGGSMEMKQNEIGTYGKIASAYDTAAGSLASQQIADAKAAAKAKQEAQGFANGVTFQPKDDLDQKILAYMQNPTNPDGSVKSLQQFEAEVNAEYGKGMISPDGTTLTGIKAPYGLEDVKNRIAERVPKDFIGSEDKYHLMAQGFSEKDAKSYAGALRYGTMTEPEKVIYRNQSPAMAKLLDEGKANESFIKDLTATKTAPDGTSQPVYSLTDLKKNNPTLTESEIKEVAMPVYEKSLMTGLKTAMDREYNGTKTIDSLRKSYLDGETVGSRTVTGIGGVKANDAYKELVDRLTLSYGDVFGPADIERIALGYIYTNLNVQ